MTKRKRTRVWIRRGGRALGPAAQDLEGRPVTDRADERTGRGRYKRHRWHYDDDARYPWVCLDCGERFSHRDRGKCHAERLKPAGD